MWNIYSGCVWLGGGMLSVIFHLFRRKQVTFWHHLWDQMIRYLSKHFNFFFFLIDFVHIVRRLNIREMSSMNVLNRSTRTEGIKFKQIVALNLSDTTSASFLGCTTKNDQIPHTKYQSSAIYYSSTFVSKLPMFFVFFFFKCITLLIFIKETF